MTPDIIDRVCLAEPRTHLVPHLVLCQPEPVALWTGQVDLDRTRQVRRVFLPPWLDPEEWLVNRRPWHATWWHPRFGADLDWPQGWQRYLALTAADHHRPYRGRTAFQVAPQPHVHRVALMELLATETFRSRFRRSLSEQVQGWLARWWGYELGRRGFLSDEQISPPRFASPLSIRQMRRLVAARHRARADHLERSLGQRETGVLLDAEEAWAALDSER